jgi:hypothetical protein
MRLRLLCWLGIVAASATGACSNDYQDFRFVRSRPDAGSDAAAGRGGAGGNAAALSDASTAGGADAAAAPDASSE